MNRSQGNLQDAFLNSSRRENIGVTIYLVSGVQLRGVIRAFDAFTVLLESQGRPPQLVYKHAIASVAPVRPVPLDASIREDQSEASPQHEASPTAPAPPAHPEPPEGTELPASPASPAPGTEPGPGSMTPEPAARELPVSP